MFGSDPSSVSPGQSKGGAASLAQVIRAEGGRVPFARFMELALTHPRVGYYTGERIPVGREGDFITIPARCPFFATAIARLLTDLVEAILVTAGGAEPRDERRVFVVEVGGGRGELAFGVLDSWRKEHPDLFGKIAWRMIEPSGSLRSLQQERLRSFVREGWDIDFLSSFRDLPSCGSEIGRVVISNEVIDALPVHLVDVRGQSAAEVWVETYGAASFREVAGPLSPEARKELAFLFGTDDCSMLRQFSEDGFLELRPSVHEFLMHAMGEDSGLREQDCSKRSSSVCIVTVDYGGWLLSPKGVRADRRHRRTLRSYRHHQQTEDVLTYAGSQDLTADVDFAALEAHGLELGLVSVLATDVACLLQAAGAQAEIKRYLQPETEAGLGSQDCQDYLERDRLASILKRVADPNDVGGLFKVMVQVRE